MALKKVNPRDVFLAHIMEKRSAAVRKSAADVVRAAEQHVRRAEQIVEHSMMVIERAEKLLIDSGRVRRGLHPETQTDGAEERRLQGE